MNPMQTQKQVIANAKPTHTRAIFRSQTWRIITIFELRNRNFLGFVFPRYAAQAKASLDRYGVITFAF